MAFTKKTIIRWGGAFDNAAADKVVHLKIRSMTEEGKTDGELVYGSRGSAIRFWTDQVAAEEWINWITETATTYSLPLISTGIEDNS
jgi:hypothetical protein